MKTYEELTGGEGRQVFYRAQRFNARDLFRQALPDLEIDRVRYTLQNLSLNGFSAAASAGANAVCLPGEQLPVEMAVRGVPLFEARGEVVRVTPSSSGAHIAVRLLDRCLDISQVVAKYQETLIRTDLAELAEAESAVPPAYRQLCADILHLIRGYRGALDRFEQTRPEARAAADMLAACEERIIPRWRSLWHAANELMLPLMDDVAARRAAKRFTELVVTPELMAGAIWRRSYEKPMGYPGDFQIMKMVYDWRREGDRLFDRLMHRIGLDVAECIATRMVMMRQAIADTVLRPSGQPACITSLGCGPAREVIDYLQLRELPRPVQFTLIDQEHAALDAAYEQSLPEVMRLRGGASVNCLRASFTQIMSGTSLLPRPAPQDLVYTVGLLDYLSPPRAKKLTASLYGQLAPGGTLIVGNMAETPTGNLWPMEFVCDWSIRYRTAAEMAELADGLGAAEVTTSFDPTGRVCLVTIRKP